MCCVVLSMCAKFDGNAVMGNNRYAVPYVRRLNDVVRDKLLSALNCSSITIKTQPLKSS